VIVLLKAFEGGYELERFTWELKSSLIAKGKVCVSLNEMQKGVRSVYLPEENGLTSRWGGRHDGIMRVPSSSIFADIGGIFHDNCSPGHNRSLTWVTAIQLLCFGLEQHVPSSNTCPILTWPSAWLGCLTLNYHEAEFLWTNILGRLKNHNTKQLYLISRSRRMSLMVACCKWHLVDKRAPRWNYEEHSAFCSAIIERSTNRHKLSSATLLSAEHFVRAEFKGTSELSTWASVAEHWRWTKFK
jgi:hypothetical protein